MKTTRSTLMVVTMITAIAVLVLANSTSATPLLDEDFQTDPLLANGTSLNSVSPNPFPGWSYEDSSLRSRTEASADVPGDANVVANQLLRGAVNVEH